MLTSPISIFPSFFYSFFNVFFLTYLFRRLLPPSSLILCPSVVVIIAGSLNVWPSRYMSCTFFYSVTASFSNVNPQLHRLVGCFFFGYLPISSSLWPSAEIELDPAFHDRKKCLCVFSIFFSIIFYGLKSLVSIEEMLRVETVGVNEQWLQNHSVMTDEAKELLSLSIWVKLKLACLVGSLSLEGALLSLAGAQ